MGGMFGCAFFGRGFRPFFLMGAAYATAMVPLWIYRLYAGALASGPFEDSVAWHGHEMVYGFALAIVAGFLLTAVANWTAGAPVRGVHLAALCVLWLAGRIAMNVPLPLWFAGTIDLLFLPALIVSLARPLWATRSVRNFVFLGMLGSLFGLDVWMVVGGARPALYFAVLVIGAMIAVVGGRIVPAFTVAALRRRGLAVLMTDQPFM
ncbi:MAG TPA: NnrS family protein, partial [Alphaproteobacteria bacterium]|nr:NnrS family protein [Alphaproteobacteria bacterium]